MFDAMIADVQATKIKPIITELFDRKKLSISVIYISQSYLEVPKVLVFKRWIYFTEKKIVRKNCYNQKIWIISIK